MKILKSLAWVTSGLLSIGLACILFFGVKFTGEADFWDWFALYFLIGTLLLLGLACFKRAVYCLRFKEKNPKLDALFEELKSGSSCLPRCFILNQIGENLLETQDEIAEDFFVKLLDSSGEQERLCAFAYLSLAKGVKKSTLEKIEEFKKNPKNAHTIKSAEPQMAAFQKYQHETN